MNNKENSKYEEMSLDCSDEKEIKDLLLFHKVIDVNTRNDTITLDNGVMLSFDGARYPVDICFARTVVERRQ